MSAKKLGRLAGLVLVLAALIGGTASGAVASSTPETSAVQYSTLEFVWE